VILKGKFSWYIAFISASHCFC